MIAPRDTEPWTARLDPSIAALFAAPVVWRLGDVGDAAAGLWSEEADAVAGAVPGRRVEFAAGRALARSALRDLGVAPCSIPVSPTRAPIWPSGFCGSISHTKQLCFVAVARTEVVASLGVDVELATPLETTLHRHICREDELDAFAGLPPLPGSNWQKLTFSAKEAFYKAYQPLAGSFLDFRDVSLRFDATVAATGAFEIVARNEKRPRHDLARRATGRWLIAHDHVLTAVVVPVA